MVTQGQAKRPERRAREWAIRTGLVLTSAVLALLLAEGLVRIFLPISERRDNITLDGNVITGFLDPGLVYRQVSNEYDVLTTITGNGHRVPDVRGNPDTVFIGDSFTFGWGLNDDDTFVSLYCKQAQVSCANLGDPGSGTLRQVERLERFLDEHDWQPREVKLFFFGMSGSFSAGNDFVDNYERDLRMREPQTPVKRESGGLTERIIALQPFLLRHSHLLRVLKFYAGPVLKALFIADPGPERMELALAATRNALTRLDGLSKREGFHYSIYLLVPVQDIMRGTSDETLATLNSVSPTPAIPTASLFADAPRDYYFAFDGHLNTTGAARVAEFLVTHDNDETN